MRGEDTEGVTEEPRELCLYLLALCAKREEPSRTLIHKNNAGTHISLNTNISIRAWCTLADTPEDAKRVGLEVALEEWPESEGWRDHTVGFNVMDRGYLADLLERMDEVTLSMVQPEPEDFDALTGGQDAPVM